MNLNPLDLLRSKRAERAADAATRYWQTLHKLASGELSDRATEAAVETIDAAAAELKKSPEDIDRDLQQLRELRDIDPKAIDDRRKKSAANLAAADAQIRRAEQAMDRAEQELAAAREARQVLVGECGVLAGYDQRLDVLRRQLAEAGCPANLLSHGTAAPAAPR